MDFLSTGKGCTLPPCIIYPLGRAVQSLDGLFIHWNWVYTSSVNYLSIGIGCTPPWIIYPLGRGVHFPVDVLSIGEGCTLPP